MLHSALTGLLCAMLAVPASAQEMMQQSLAPAPETTPGQAIDRATSSTLAHQDVSLAASSALLSPDARLLLVLDRFTYGPRPGNLDKLRAMGLNEWFTRQFNPGSIDDSAFEERLDQYPAMKLSLDRLLADFPPNDAARAALNGRKGPTGLDNASGRAVLKHREEAYKQRQQKKAGDAKPDAEVVPLPVAAQDVVAMDPAPRFKLLCKLTDAQLRELNRELTGPDRQRLMDGFTPAQTETLAAFNGPTAVIAGEDVQTRLLHDIYSERQLLEVMTDFWLNHFNVYMGKNQQEAYYIASYQRDVIRPRALGHFRDLLLAVAQSPAMLEYLDQSESVGPHSIFATRPFQNNKAKTGLNENYARELMELHTIGVDGGYTQHDVTEMAKVFTGWTVQPGYRTGQYTHAVYDPNKHEPGKKVVLGHIFKDRGLEEGYEALEMLAASPQCAHFISQKLAVHFVSDNPPKAMVDRMTQTFLNTQGDIRRVLLAMINSPEFFTTATFRAKVKTPQEFVISSLRATGAEVDNPAALVRTLQELGMPVFGHLTPEGYSMRSDAWNSTTALVSRMNFSMALATNRVQGVHVDVTKLLGADPSVMTPEQKQAEIEARLLHIRVSPKTEQLIAAETTAPPEQQRAQLAQISSIAGGGNRYIPGKRAPLAPNGRPLNNLAGIDPPTAMATGLVLGSPEFQRR